MHSSPPGTSCYASRTIRTRRQSSSAPHRSSRLTRWPGRAWATRCSAWAAPRRPPARSTGRSGCARRARRRCGAALARTVSQLVPLLQVSTKAADALRAAFGNFSTRSYRHVSDDSQSIEVARFSDQPSFGRWTYATLGLANTVWRELGRPRVELLFATTIDTEVCGQVLATLAFHLSSTGFFPEPGVMVRDVIGALGAGDLSQRLPHVYVTVPR